MCLALVAVAGRSGAADRIYYFLDERGVAHFSNVPADPRYRLFLRSTTEPSPDANGVSPEVIVFAPPMVDRGSEFSVTILLAGSSAVQGWLEFSFDTAVLTLLSATSQHDAPEPGRVRLRVPGDMSTPFSADLHFRASATASDATSIDLMQTSLITANGESVVANTPAAALVAISSFDR
jgi:hypothetical protein